MRKFWDSSVGKKVVMGLSGLLGIGFLIVHMLGNLQAFMGAERFDAYSHLLKVQVIELTWAVRAGLLVAVVLHVIAAYQLTMRNRAARPVAYGRRDPQVSTYASRTMRWGGVYLLAFIILHLGQFTLGWAALLPEWTFEGAFRNVTIAFGRVQWVVLYLGAMAFLALHLYHGAWASLRTLGIAPTSAQPLRRRIPLVLAIVVAGGFSLVPLGVALGIIK
jgi:succinate dehydrogenase / fumarate reductase cytochrome b subunit